MRAAHMEHGTRAPIWELNDKASGYRFALSHGVPIPLVYGEYDQASSIDWGTLPDEFVVKATSGAAGRGVFPLVKGVGGYHDLLSGSSETRTSHDIVALLEAMSAENAASAGVIVEELLRAPEHMGLAVLPDYKLFCFHGVVGLIMVIGRSSRTKGGQRFRFFSTEGDDLGDVTPNLPMDKTLPAPTHLAALLDAGERISAGIQSPFVRVDMYEREDNVVFGEITPAPGGEPVLREDMDVHLGDLWEAAEQRLELAAIEAGLRQPRFGPHTFQSLTTGPASR